MEKFFAQAQEFFASSAMMKEVGLGILETLYITIVSSIIAYAIGLPLGLLLTATDKKGLKPNKAVNSVLGFIINFLRSVPFMILIVWVMPITSGIIGHKTGTPGALIVPMVISAFPFVARMVEQSASETDPGVIEAAQAMGASDFKIITSVILRESKPGLIAGAAITVTTIVGYTAMGSLISAGGIGVIGITYGHYNFNNFILTLAVIVLVIMVQLFQSLGLKLSSKLDNRKK